MNDRDKIFSELEKNGMTTEEIPEAPNDTAAEENRNEIKQTRFSPEQYNSERRYQQHMAEFSPDPQQEQLPPQDQPPQEHEQAAPIQHQDRPEPRMYDAPQPQQSPPPPPMYEHPNPQPTPQRYDEIMYRPIGFAEYEAYAAAQLAQADAIEKKKRDRRDKTIILLVVILIIISFVIAVLGIVYDVATGSKRMSNMTSPENVVIYQNKKPAGANDNIADPDENGKYTTEGVAMVVRDSIVEIYTYEDSFQNKLKGTGSGVILNEDGYIVTNAHVLDAEGFHDVHTANGKVYSATIVGRDSKTDIAVLKINAEGLVPAVLGDSDEVVVGEEVIAVGNPAGLTGTVTNGIVSAVNREIRSDSTGFEMNCIQTNADISPGNSGGALVNMYGQVIGITSSKYISSYYEGLGFAITINEAKPIIEELISNGFIGGRFRIGITLIDMSNELNIAAIEDKLGFEIPEKFKGIYIDDVSEDCDIANTELKSGDFITKINGTPVTTYDELYNTISASYGAGDVVPATCARIDKKGNIDEFEIEFKLMEDTSGDY